MFLLEFPELSFRPELEFSFISLNSLLQIGTLQWVTSVGRTENFLLAGTSGRFKILVTDVLFCSAAGPRICDIENSVAHISIFRNKKPRRCRWGEIAAEVSSNFPGLKSDDETDVARLYLASAWELSSPDERQCQLTAVFLLTKQ